MHFYVPAPVARVKIVSAGTQSCVATPPSCEGGSALDSQLDVGHARLDDGAFFALAAAIRNKPNHAGPEAAGERGNGA
jgi:hypothetical protein